jgi:acyl dehydratase
MLVVDHPQDLKRYIGRELEPSDWVAVDQEMIDKFADATGDHQWIHVDVDRARREMPAGQTIAHGYLLLSLVPRMKNQTHVIRDKKHGINYGSNRVRFVNPVAAGSRVRLRYRVKSVDDIRENGVRIVAECTVEIEGEERPALVAELISLAYA